jgi:hypothetical protein
LAQALYLTTHMSGHCNQLSDPLKRCECGGLSAKEISRFNPFFTWMFAPLSIKMKHGEISQIEKEGSFVAADAVIFATGVHITFCQCAESRAAKPNCSDDHVPFRAPSPRESPLNISLFKSGRLNLGWDSKTEFPSRNPWQLVERFVHETLYSSDTSRLHTKASSSRRLLTSRIT